jgi:peptidoglycan/xylan/chitin deacetylase (PgdA/CDA1 family)
MYDISKISQYIINDLKCEKLILNIGPVSAHNYHQENDPVTYGLHYKTGDVSFLNYALRYGFLNPKYGKTKLETFEMDSFVQGAHDVFNPDTGAYDKSRRDIENIGYLEDYLVAYPVFANYPPNAKPLTSMDCFLDDMHTITDLCEEKGIDLEVVIFPMYGDYATYYSYEDIEMFYKELVEITDFWDFSLSSLSKDPRFFYDASHFRNTMGEMMVSKMNNLEDRYIPEDFGRYVTKDNIHELLATYQADYGFTGSLDDQDYSKEITIINYHHFSDDYQSGATITIDRFEEQLLALKEAGYETVHVSDLIDYVELGKALPEKPLVITIDDGYTSNYSEAFPLLQSLDMKATIFMIGSSIGLENYKDTDYDIIPHFTLDQAKEMVDSGLIEIQSHTYDFHQYGPYESDEATARENMLMLDGESEVEYVQLMTDDFNLMKDVLGQLQLDMYALAYPRGEFDDKTEILSSQAGIKATFTTQEGRNMIIKGLPQSLRQLNRYTPWQETTGDDLIQMITN